MLKKGFTLAEVLITLIIVGVVAALASPVLVGAFQKSKVGPSLRKFMNTIETANEHILGDNEADQISNVAANESEYLTLLSKYVSGAPAKITKDVEKTDEDGNTKTESKTTLKTIKDVSISISNFVTVTSSVQALSPNEDSVIYTMSDGSEFAVKYELDINMQGNQNKAEGGYKGKRATVYYDINGFEVGPNKVAKDIFWFILDDNGSLIPFGGRTYANAYGGNVLWKNAGLRCNESEISTAGSRNCSGSIADNNWKVIYKY